MEQGFSRLELVATLTGEPLYGTHGFGSVERFDVPLAKGAALPVVRMTKRLTCDHCPGPAKDMAHLP